MKPSWVTGYLERLGLEAERPTLDYLTRIVGAHLSTIPFENVTKFYYFRRHQETGWYIPPIADYVANLTRLHGGGTCFTANANFHQLLAALGFDLHYVANGPRTHMGSVVRLPEGRFYVDVGGGGPLLEPVNLAGGARQELNGQGTHIYPVEGRPGLFHFHHLMRGQVTLEWELHADEDLSYADFGEPIAKANLPGALFLTFLRCLLYQPQKQRTLSLVNNTLTIRHPDGTESKQVLPTVEAIEAAVTEEFGLPNLPVREAIETLASLGIDIFAPKE